MDGTLRREVFDLVRQAYLSFEEDTFSWEAEPFVDTLENTQFVEIPAPPQADEPYRYEVYVVILFESVSTFIVEIEQDGAQVRYIWPHHAHGLSETEYSRNFSQTEGEWKMRPYWNPYRRR